MDGCEQANEDFQPSYTTPEPYQTPTGLQLTENNKNVANIKTEGGIDMPRKLKHGQGTITKRERRTKTGAYFYHQGKYQIDGVTYYVTAPTYSECYDRLAKLRNTTKKATVFAKNNNTLAAWLEEWLKVYKEKTIVAATMHNYKATIQNHIPDEMKKRRIDKIRANEIQEVINKLAERSPRVARTLYDIFKMSFLQAYNSDYIPKDVTRGLVKPKHISQEEQPLSKEQQAQLLATCAGKFKYAVMGYLWTGCRVSELLTIKWTDYDTAKNELYIDGTKTATSKRTIPVFPPLHDLLASIEHTSEYIWDISDKTLDRHKKEVEAALGWKFTLKSLRHTFNQNLFEMGVSDIVRAKWMGHSKPATTNKVYTHTTDALTKKEIAKVIAETEE